VSEAVKGRRKGRAAGGGCVLEASGNRPRNSDARVGRARSALSGPEAARPTRARQGSENEDPPQPRSAPRSASAHAVGMRWAHGRPGARVGRNAFGSGRHWTSASAAICPAPVTAASSRAEPARRTHVLRVRVERVRHLAKLPASVLRAEREGLRDRGGLAREGQLSRRVGVRAAREGGGPRRRPAAGGRRPAAGRRAGARAGRAGASGRGADGPASQRRTRI